MLIATPNRQQSQPPYSGGDVELVGHLLIQGQTLHAQRFRPLVLTLLACHLRKGADSHGYVWPVPDSAGDRQRGFVERCRPLVVAILEALSSQADEREGNAAIVPQLPVELQRLPVQLSGAVVIAPMPGERACLAQELRPRGHVGGGRVDTVALAQRRLQPPTPLREVRAYFPEARQRP